MMLFFFFHLGFYGQVFCSPCGTWTGSDRRAGGLCFCCKRRCAYNNQLFEAILGHPGRNMKNELYVLKNTTCFPFLLVKVTWDIASYPKYPGEMEFLFTWGRFSQARRQERFTHSFSRYLFIEAPLGSRLYSKPWR